MSGRRVAPRTAGRVRPAPLSTRRPAPRHLAHRVRSQARTFVLGVLTLALLAGGVAQVGSARPAQAAVASSFAAGSIIADPVFRDSGSMSAAAVQDFLSDRVTSCSPGSTCLPGYTETTWTRTDAQGLCSDYPGAANESAAQIIVKVGAACGINPKVLIVLLQKEQGLVTATSPTNGKYQKATGYGCPDGAPCNSQYYGFFNQVYLAAHQFRLYMNNPAKYGYQAGRSNFVQYNPNSSCGGTQVYIGNAATAALYDYTPYVPNASAMANLYGTGDSCSAYGNRNFWRYFTDWFGSPQSGGFFVKSAGNPAVYLVTDSGKLPVPTLAIAAAFAPLGAIGTVSDSYLASLPTGPMLGNVVSSSSGAIYLVDRGAKHYVGSCDLVADYGATCGALPVLGDVEISDLGSGDPLTETLKSPSSPVVWIADGGTKHQVISWDALVASGASTSVTTLSAATVNALTVGTPVAPNDIMVTASDSGQKFLLTPDGASLVPPALAALPQYASVAAGSLEGASIRALGFTATQTGAVSNSGTSWLLTADGLRVAASDGALAGLRTTPWTDGMLATVSPTGPSSPPDGLDIAVPGSPVVYRAADGRARPVLSWADLQALSGTQNPQIATLPSAVFAGMTTAGPVLPPALVVKTPSSGAVYVTDGSSTLWHLPSFDIAGALGLPALRTVPASSLSAYTTAGDLTDIVSCGSVTSLGWRGSLRAMPDGVTPAATPLGASTCGSLSTGPALKAPVLLQEKGSAQVWVLTDGVKQPVGSWAALVRLAGSSPTILPLPAGALSHVAVGTPLS